MFALFHVPLTDVRPFVDEPTGRVGNPLWPLVLLPDEPHRRPFVRGFGVARERLSGGADEWAGEDFFCDLDSAVRYVGTVLKPLAARPGLRRYGAFRRLYWDGQFVGEGSVVGRAEFGFGLRLQAGAAPLSAAEVAAVADGVLRQPVRVVAPGGAPQPMLLSHCGSALAQAYLTASTVASTVASTASTASPQPTAAITQPWWLSAGTPLLMLEGRERSEVDTWPAPARPLAELAGVPAAGLRIFHGRRTLEGRERPVWYFECDSDGFHDHDLLRRLRLNVIRLHSALAALRLLADLQARERLHPQQPDTQRRLQQSLGLFMPLLYRERQHGMPLPPLVAAALTMAEALTPSMFASLRKLVRAPGRGLANQLDRAAERLPDLQPAPEPAPQWDIFIAHAGADLPAAQALHAALGSRARVFLDQQQLLPGDPWDLLLAQAQRSSRMTVVLVGDGVERAWYLRSEIAAAISLARVDGSRHRVVPVYLNGADGRATAQPYGLNLLHGIELGAGQGWPPVAERLLQALQAAPAAGPGLSPQSAP